MSSFRKSILYGEKGVGNVKSLWIKVFKTDAPLRVKFRIIKSGGVKNRIIECLNSVITNLCGYFFIAKKFKGKEMVR